MTSADDRQPTPPAGHARTTIAILRQAKRDGDLPPDEADEAIERHREAEREHRRRSDEGEQ